MANQIPARTVLTNVNPLAELGLFKCTAAKGTAVSNTPSQASFARVSVCKGKPRNTTSSAAAASTNTIAEIVNVFSIEVAAIGSMPKLKPRVTAAKMPARRREAAPIAVPTAKLRSQPEWNDQPIARKGSSSKIAPQAQPTRVAEASKIPAPITKPAVPLNSSTADFFDIAGPARKTTVWRSFTQTKKAPTKNASRQPLRR